MLSSTAAVHIWHSDACTSNGMGRLLRCNLKEPLPAPVRHLPARHAGGAGQALLQCDSSRAHNLPCSPGSRAGCAVELLALASLGSQLPVAWTSVLVGHYQRQLVKLQMCRVQGHRSCRSASRQSRSLCGCCPLLCRWLPVAGCPYTPLWTGRHQ